MYPFLTRYRQNFGKIIQEGSVKRCQDKVLRKLMTAAATTRLRLCRKKKRLVKSRALTICMENQKIPGRIQMERFIPVEIFGKKVMPFEVLLFSFFYWNDRNLLYHLFGLLVPGFHSCPEKAKTLPVFCQRYNSIPFLFSVPKKYQYHLTEIFQRNFRGKRSRYYLFSRFYGSERNFLYHLFGLLVPGFMSREGEKLIGIF